MRVDYQDYNQVLSKFLAYLESVEIIFDYIKDCGEPTFNIKDDVEQVASSYGNYVFTLGETSTEEITNIYHLLKHIVDHNIPVAMSVAMGYSHSNKYQDKIKGFNERVSMVLIRHIEGYLTKIGIDMGMNESTTYSITVNNGQVNLATDNATINAVQNNGVDVNQLKMLIDTIRKEATGNCTSDDMDTVNESLEVIENELTQPSPKKSLLKTAITGLNAIKGTIEFSAAVAALVQFAQAIM